MGIFSIFKRKPKITREAVMKAIIDLQRHLDQTEDRIDSLTEERSVLLTKGKQTKDQHKRLYIGKKIRYIDQELKDKTDQAMMIMYNIQLSKQLQLAIENQSFIESVGAVSVNKILNNPKELANFLNKALKRRVNHETMLTEADDLFVQVKEQYQGNEQIYGINESDDEILAMFEQDDITEIETEKSNADDVLKETNHVEGS